jgi:predicted Zn-dependent protease
MSNLVCASGTASEDELLYHMQAGIYIHRLADGLGIGGNVRAEIVLAERVRRGRRTGECLAGGQVCECLGFLTSVVELGRERPFHDNAMCGKAGQLLFDVGTAAPALRFASLRVAA